MKTWIATIFGIIYIGIASAQQPVKCDTVRVSEFGVLPYTYENCVEELQAAIRACKERNAKVLVFEEGRYDIWTDGAIRREYFITNTSTEKECPSKIKTIGMLFKDMEGLTIEGNNATLMFHGKITMLTFEHCRQMCLRNIHIDFERPGGSEMTYTKVENGSVELAFHRDSRYDFVNGKLKLIGEGWLNQKIHCIEYDPQNEHFFYSTDWSVLENSPATEIAPGIVQFTTPADFHPKLGNTLTVRDIIRDQVGMFIYESSDITFENVDVYYMHGLGIVSQYTHNVTMNNVRCAPREKSGRILASSADFMHFSGCSGKVSVINCDFAGSHDDPINVHGTNLRAVQKKNDLTLVLRFMHGQSYGYNAYFKGDTVAFVKATTMERYAKAVVIAVKRLTDRTIEVTFDRKVPKSLKLNSDCVENMTRTPEVEIRNCFFTRTSTRGTLVTTPRRVVISGNIYYKTGMSAILIEGDAKGWYESGPVKDVLIENNIFIDCAYFGGPEKAVIALNPSNSVINANRPVHRNVRIIGNEFLTHGNPALYAKSTEGLTFNENELSLMPSVSEQSKPMFILTGCKNMTIENNFISFTPKKFFELQNMKKGNVSSDIDNK